MPSRLGALPGAICIGGAGEQLSRLMAEVRSTLGSWIQSPLKTTDLLQPIGELDPMSRLTQLFRSQPEKWIMLWESHPPAIWIRSKSRLVRSVRDPPEESMYLRTGCT